MSTTRRATSRRWGLVGVAVAVLLSLPQAVGALPAGDARDTTPAKVLDQVRGSADVPHVGYVESQGTLLLPDVAELGDLAELLGSTKRIRVWWAGEESWRVDTLSPVGERDEFADAEGTWSFDSERRRALRTLGRPDVRLPRAGDLLPTELGRRLAAAATPEEATRLPARRIAGRDTRGVRITPADPRTSIARVDLWADRETGLPVRVELTGRGTDLATVSTQFLDLAFETPGPDVVRFEAPADVPVETTTAPDLAALVDRLAPFRLPPDLAGLPRRARAGALGGSGGVATYGDGYVLLAVVPLPGRAIAPLLRALEGPTGVEVTVPGAEAAGVDTAVVKGVAVRLAGERGGGAGFLLAGTVTDQVLADAAAELVRRVRVNPR